MRKTITQLLITCGIGLLPYVVQAFGISPAVLEINDLLPESTAEATIYISRANPDTTDTATVTVDGNGAAAIMLSDQPISLPQGEVNVPFTFSIQPIDFDTGSYTAALTFVYAAGDHPTAEGVTVQSGIESTVQFSVTNDLVTNLDIDGVEIVQLDNTSAQLEYVLLNQGNTTAGIKKISLEYTDSSGSSVATVIVEEDRLPIVPPFTSTVETIALKNDLPAELYTITAIFYGIDDQILLTTTPLHLQILAEPEGMTTTNPDQSNHWWWYLSIGLTIGCIAIIGLWYAKMNK